MTQADSDGPLDLVVRDAHVVASSDYFSFDSFLPSLGRGNKKPTRVVRSAKVRKADSVFFG